MWLNQAPEIKLYKGVMIRLHHKPLPEGNREVVDGSLLSKVKKVKEVMISI